MKIRLIIDTENPGDFRGYDDATGEELDIQSVRAGFVGCHGTPDVAIRWRDPATPIPRVPGGYRRGEDYEARTPPIPRERGAWIRWWRNSRAAWFARAFD